MILAGDVGGTKVHLCLYEFEDGRLQHVTDERFPAPHYPGLEPIVREFLQKNKDPELTSACFGVPGPVRNGRLKLTNLPWLLDARELARNLDIDHLFLINDLEANGYGIPELTRDQVYTLSLGDPSALGNRGLVSAGTGLGEAVLMWNGKMHIPVASEGGHCDFAPRNELEVDLLRYLQKCLGGRVSYERVISGIGLKSVYAFLRDERGLPESPELKQRLAEEDPNAVIGELGESDNFGRIRFRVRCRGRQSRAQGAGDRRDVYRRRHRAQNPEQDERRRVFARIHRQGPAFRAVGANACPYYPGTARSADGRRRVCRSARRG